MERREFMKTAGLGILGLVTGLVNLGNMNYTKISLEKMLINSSENKPKDETHVPLDYSPELLNKYNSWIDSTLIESVKNKCNSLVVDKTGKALYLIKSGKVDSKYAIELGYNPLDDKQESLDGCTPEGMYKVEKKLSPPNTNFYKAFLINYPNEEDKAKGKTGNLIEVHGGGEQGFNWTLGCVALSNKDIDKVFPHINKEDRITIVKYTSRNLFPKNLSSINTD